MCKLFSVLAILFTLCQTLAAEIKETAQIEEAIQHIKPDTLVVLDIDNTVLRPSQMLGSDMWFSYYLENLQKSGLDKKDALRASVELLNKIYEVTEVQLIDEKTPEIIQELQAKNCIVIALTARGHEVDECTVKQLLSVGIDLQKNAPVNNDFYVHNLPEVKWYKGVLFAHGQSKAKVLHAFLEQIQYEPKQILCIDDKQPHLAELELHLATLKIPFLGLRYSGADANVKEFCPEVADIQLKHFESILSDEAGYSLLQNSTVQEKKQITMNADK
jgi:hypothetical protein